MIAGLLLTVLLIVGIGIWSGRRVNDYNTFATGGGRASGWVVCGTIMGTIVSGQSTVGTAQLAFHFGLSAWWFTLGAALGCLLLAVLYVKPLRASGCTTLMEVVRKEYGPRAEMAGSCLCILGIFISIVAQIIASSALLATLLPIGCVVAALVAAGLMLLYVVFGGLWGAGWGGIVKMALLYVASIVAGVFVWRHSQGLQGLFGSIDGSLKMMGLPNGGDYRSVFARGPLKDMGSCLSIALGVLATQTYAQGVWAGRSDGAARKGTLLCAFLIPPIGAACTLVGLYMRAHYATPLELTQAGGAAISGGIGTIADSAQAFPLFVTNHLSPFFGGVVLGTLFITIVGGGAGLALGCATIIHRDIVGRIANRRSQSSLLQIRLTIVALLLLAVVVSLVAHSTLINDLGFLSLGLRATAVLVPLSCALFFPGRIKPHYALVSMVAGTVMLLVAQWLRLPADPFYWGMGIGMVVCLLGVKKR